MSRLSADHSPRRFNPPIAAAPLGEAGRLPTSRARRSSGNFLLGECQPYFEGSLEAKKYPKEDTSKRTLPSVHFHELERIPATASMTPRGRALPVGNAVATSLSGPGRTQKEGSRLERALSFSELCVCSEEAFNMWLIDVVVGIPPLPGQVDGKVDDSDDDTSCSRKKDDLHAAYEKLQKAIAALEGHRYKLLGHTRVLDAYYEALEEDIRQGNDPLRKNSEFHYHLRESRRTGIKGKYAYEQTSTSSRLEKLYYVVSKLESTKEICMLKILVKASAADPYASDKSNSTSEDKAGATDVNALGASHGGKNSFLPVSQGTSTDFSLVDVPYPPLKDLSHIAANIIKSDAFSMRGKTSSSLPSTEGRHRQPTLQEQSPEAQLTFRQWQQSLEGLERNARGLQAKLLLPLPANEVISRMRNELLFSFSARVLALRDPRAAWSQRRLQHERTRRFPTSVLASRHAALEQGKGKDKDKEKDKDKDRGGSSANTTTTTPTTATAATASIVPCSSAPSCVRREGTGTFVEWYVREVVDPFALRQLLTMVPLETVVTTTCRLIDAREAASVGGRLGGRASAVETGADAALPDLSHVVLCTIREGRTEAFAKLTLSSIVSFLDARYLSVTKALFFYAALLSGQMDLIESMLECGFFHDQALHVLLFLNMNTHDADCAAFLSAQLQLVRATLLEYQESADEDSAIRKYSNSKTCQDLHLGHEESEQQLLRQAALLLLQHGTSGVFDNDKGHRSEDNRENLSLNSKQTPLSDNESQNTVPKEDDVLWMYYDGYNRPNRPISMGSNAQTFPSFFDGSVQQLRLFLQIRRLTLDKGKRETAAINSDAPMYSLAPEALMISLAKRLEERLEKVHLKDLGKVEGEESLHEENPDSISFNDLLLRGMLDVWSIGSLDAIMMPSYSTLYLRRVGPCGYVPLQPTARPILVRGDTYVDPIGALAMSFLPGSCLYGTHLPKPASASSSASGITSRSIGGERRTQGYGGVFYYEAKVSVDFLLPPTGASVDDPPMTSVIIGWCTEGMSSLVKRACHPAACAADQGSMIHPGEQESDQECVVDTKAKPGEKWCVKVPKDGLGYTRDGFGVSLQLMYQKPRDPATAQKTTFSMEEEIVWGVWKHHNGETAPILKASTDPTGLTEMACLRIIRREPHWSKDSRHRRFYTIYPKVEVIAESDLSHCEDELAYEDRSSGKGFDEVRENASAPDPLSYGRVKDYGVLVDDELPLYGTHVLNFGFLYDVVKDDVALFINGVSLGVVFPKINRTTSGSPLFRRLYPAATLLTRQEMVDDMQSHMLDLEGSEDVEKEKVRLGAERYGDSKNTTDEPSEKHFELAAVLRFAFDRRNLIFYDTVEEHRNLNKPLSRMGLREDVATHSSGLDSGKKCAYKPTAWLKPLQLFDHTYKLRLLLRTLTSSQTFAVPLGARATSGNEVTESAAVLENPSAAQPDLIEVFSQSLLRSEQNRKLADECLELAFHCPVCIPRRTEDHRNAKRDGNLFSAFKITHIPQGNSGDTHYHSSQSHVGANYGLFFESRSRVYTIISENILLSPLCATLAFRLPHMAYDILCISPLSALHLSDDATAFSKAAVHARRTAFLAACALGYEEVVRVLCKFMPAHEILKLFGIQMTSDGLKQMQEFFFRKKRTVLLSCNDEDSAQQDRSGYIDRNLFQNTFSYPNDDYSVFTNNISLDTLYTVHRGLYTPLHCALLGGNHTGCAMVLMDFLQKCLTPSARARALAPSSRPLFLIDALNMLTPMGESALMMAARYSNIGLAIRLLEFGAKATAVDRFSRENVLEIACANGCVPIAHALLYRPQESQDCYDASLLNHVGVASCLCWSALNNLPEIIPLLLSRGADPQIMLEDSSPLLLAVTFGNQQAALALLERTHSHQEVAKLIRLESEDVTSLSTLTAADTKPLDGVKVEKKTQKRQLSLHTSEKPILDVDAIEPHSHCTALHIACELGQKQVVQGLLGKGASLNIRSKTNGYTPLHTALLNNQEEVAMTLLEFSKNRLRHGVCILDLLASDASGNTTLHVAARQGISSVVEYILEQFSDEEINRLRELRAYTKREPAVAPISVTNNQGRTPLLVAIHAGHALTAQVIISLIPKTTPQPGGPVIEGTCLALLQAMKNNMHEVVLSMLTLGNQNLFPASNAFQELFFELYNPLQDASASLVGCGQETVESAEGNDGGGSNTNRWTESSDQGGLATGNTGVVTANSASTSLDRIDGGSGQIMAKRRPRHGEASAEYSGRLHASMKATNYTETLMLRTRTQTRSRKITSTKGFDRVKLEATDSATQGQERRSLIMRALLARGRAISPTLPSRVMTHLLRGFALPEIFLMLELVAAESPVIGIQNPSAMVHGEAITGFLQEHCDVYIAPARVVPFCKEVFQYLQEQLCAESHQCSLATSRMWWLKDMQTLKTWRTALQRTANLKDISANSALCHQIMHAIRLHGRRNDGLCVLEEMEAVVNHFLNKAKMAQKGKDHRSQPEVGRNGPKGDGKVSDNGSAMTGSTTDEGSDDTGVGNNSIGGPFTEEMFEGLFGYSVLQLSASLELPHVVSFLLEKLRLDPLHAPAQQAQGQQEEGPPPPPLPVSPATPHSCTGFARPNSPVGPGSLCLNPDASHSHGTWSLPVGDLREPTEAKWGCSPFRLALRTLHAPTVAAFLRWRAPLAASLEPAWVDPLQRAPPGGVLATRPGRGGGGGGAVGAEGGGAPIGKSEDPAGKGPLRTGGGRGRLEASPRPSTVVTPRMVRALEVCEELLHHGAAASGHFDANGMDAWMLAVSIGGYAGEKATALLLEHHKNNRAQLGIPPGQQNCAELFQLWGQHNFGLSFNMTLMAPAQRLLAAITPVSNDCTSSTPRQQQTDTNSYQKEGEPNDLESNRLVLTNPYQDPLSIVSLIVPTVRFPPPLSVHQGLSSNSEVKRNAKGFGFSPLGSKYFTHSATHLKDTSASSVLGGVVHPQKGPHKTMHFQYYYYVTLLFATAEHNPVLLKAILNEIKYTKTTGDRSAKTIVHPTTKDTLLIFILKKAYRHSLLLSSSLHQVPYQDQKNTREGAASTTRKEPSLHSESVHSHRINIQSVSNDAPPQVPPRALSLQSVQSLLKISMTIIHFMESQGLYHSASDGETALSLAAQIGYMPLVRQLVLSKPLRQEFPKSAVDSTCVKNSKDLKVQEDRPKSKQADGGRHVDNDQHTRRFLIFNLSSSAVRTNIATRLYYDEVDAETLFTILSCIQAEIGKDDLINFLTMVYPNLHPVPALQIAAAYATYAKYFLTAPACMNAFWVNLLYVQYAGRLDDLGITTVKWDLLLHALLPGAPAVPVYLIQKKCPVLENPTNDPQNGLQGGRHRIEREAEAIKGAPSLLQHLGDNNNAKKATSVKSKRSNRVPSNPWGYISSRVSLLLQMMALTAADSLMVKPAKYHTFSQAVASAEATTLLSSTNNVKRRQNSRDASHDKNATMHLNAITSGQGNSKQGLHAVVQDLSSLVHNPRGNEHEKEGSVPCGYQSGALGDSENGLTCGWANTLLGDVAELAVRYDDVDVFVDLVRLRIPRQFKKLPPKQRPQEQSMSSLRQGKTFNSGAPISSSYSQFSDSLFVAALASASTYCSSLRNVHNTHQLNGVMERLQNALWCDIIEDKHVDLLAVAAGSINLLQYLYDASEKGDVEREDKSAAVLRQLVSPLRYDRIDIGTGFPEGISPAPCKPMEASPWTGANAALYASFSFSSSAPRTLEVLNPPLLTSNSSFGSKLSTTAYAMDEDSVCSVPVITKEDTSIRAHLSKDSPPLTISRQLSTSEESSRLERASLRMPRGGMSMGDLLEDDDAYISGRWVGNSELGGNFVKRHKVMAVIWGTGAGAKMLDYGSGRCKGFAAVAAPLLNFSMQQTPLSEEIKPTPLIPNTHLPFPLLQKGGAVQQLVSFANQDPVGILHHLPLQQVAPSKSSSSLKQFMYLIGDWCMHSSLVLHSPYPSLVTLDVLEFFMNRRAPLSLSVLQLFLRGTWLSSSATNELQAEGWWQPYGCHTRGGQPLTIHYQSPAHGDTLLHLLVINDQCELAEYYLAYCLYYFVRIGLDTPPPPAYHSCVPALLREMDSIKGIRGVCKGDNGKTTLPVNFLRIMLRCNAHGLTPMDYAHNSGMIYLLHNYGCVPPTYHLYPQRISQWLGLRSVESFHPANKTARNLVGSRGNDREKNSEPRGAELPHVNCSVSISKTRKEIRPTQEEHEKGFFPVPRLALISEDLLTYHDDPDTEDINGITDYAQGSSSYALEANRRSSRLKGSPFGGDLTRRVSLTRPRARTEIPDAVLFRALLVSQRLTNDIIKPIILNDDVSLLHIGLCSSDDELVRQYCSIRKQSLEKDAGGHSESNEFESSVQSSKVIISETKASSNTKSHNVSQLSSVAQVLYLLPPLPDMESYLDLDASVLNSLSNSCRNGEASSEPGTSEAKSRKASLHSKTNRTRSQTSEKRGSASTNTRPSMTSNPLAHHGHNKTVSHITLEILNLLEKRPFVVYPLSLRPLHPAIGDTGLKQTAQRLQDLASGKGKGGRPKTGAKKASPHASSGVFCLKMMAIHHGLLATAAAEEARRAPPPTERELLAEASLLLALTPMQLALASGGVRRPLPASGGGGGGALPQQYRSQLRPSSPLLGEGGGREGEGGGGGGGGPSPTGWGLAERIHSAPVLSPPPFAIGGGGALANALDGWVATTRVRQRCGRAAVERSKSPFPALVGGNSKGQLRMAPQGGVASVEQQRLMGLLLRELDRCLGIERAQREAGLVVGPNYDVDLAGDAVAAARQLKAKKVPHKHAKR